MMQRCITVGYGMVACLTLFILALLGWRGELSSAHGDLLGTVLALLWVATIILVVAQLSELRSIDRAMVAVGMVIASTFGASAIFANHAYAFALFGAFGLLGTIVVYISLSRHPDHLYC